MSCRGAVALPAVLLAMTVMSALVVGGVYSARTLGVRARLLKSSAENYAPVEHAIVELVAGWDSASRAALPIGGVESSAPAIIDGVPVSASVTRLNQRTYWLVAEARRSPSHGIASRLALLIRVSDGQVRPVPGPAWTRLP